MVLNPDVVVRSRGVMEKCSMCIQMTQATILEAKKEGRKVATGRILYSLFDRMYNRSYGFGDVNNDRREVAHLAEDKRAYHVLDYYKRNRM